MSSKAPNKGPPRQAMQVLQSPPWLPPSTPRKIYRRWQRSAWIRSSRLKPFVWNEKASWRLGSPISIMGSPIWSATTSASSVRITSIPPAPPALIAHPLQLCSFAVGSAFVGTSTSAKEAEEWFPCLRSSSKLSFERVSETPGFSWTQPGAELSETPSTSRRKFRIGRLTSSTSNLSLLNLMLTRLQKSPLSFVTFVKELSLR